MTETRTTSKPALSVVIAAHNRPAHLAHLLAGLAGQTLDAGRFEVIVADDGSPTPLQVDAAALPFRCEVVRQDHRGPATARNRGIERCGAPLVLFLDDDSLVAPDLLERHLAAHHDAARRGQGDVVVRGSFRFSTAARASAFVRLLDGSGLLNDCGPLVPLAPPEHDSVHDWRYMSASNVSLARHALLAVGGFDGNLFDGVTVDGVELGLRLGARGLRVLYREDCVAEHDHPWTPREAFARHARQGFFATRLWAKHNLVEVLGARDDDGVQGHFDSSIETIERLGEHPEQLIQSLERLDVELEGRALTAGETAEVVSTLKAVIAARWSRGVHLARYGFDPLAVRKDGAPEGTTTTIVIVSYNALANTQRCLASLEAAADPRYPQRILVVDNGSTDGSREWLAQRSGIELIQNPDNYGAPRARNQALHFAMHHGGGGHAAGLGDWVAFLDNDIVVPRGWLARALYHGAIDPGVGSIPLCANRASKHQVVPYQGDSSDAQLEAFAARHYAAAPRRGQDTMLFTSLAVLVRREVIAKLGGFDERFSPWGFEDDDLALRVKLAGWRNRVARDTFVYHAHYDSHAKSERHAALMHTNWRHFVAKWCGELVTPPLFDYSGLRFPAPGTATQAQLVAPLPAPDAAPPLWEGQEPAQRRAPNISSSPRAPLPTTPRVPARRATVSGHTGHMAP